MPTTTPLPIPSPQRLMAERRSAPRRRQPVRVLALPDDCALDEPYGAWVLDTSPAGARLRFERQDIAVGSLLWLRRPAAAASVPWVAVRVLHRAAREQGWELGCAFAGPKGSQAGLYYR